MKVRALGIAALVAGIFIPGVLPAAVIVIAVRRFKKYRARNQIKRIVIAYGQRADHWGQA